MILSTENSRMLAAQELNEIKNEIIALATDQELYRRVQHEVIQKNRRLLTMRSPFFEILKEGYAHATASRIRRLVDRDHRTVSLRKLVEQLSKYPALYEERASSGDLEDLLSQMDTTCKRIKDYVDQYVAHHDRNSSADIPTHRELNEAIDNLISIYRKCYAIVNNTDIDVVVHFGEDPLSIFRFAWLEAPESSPELSLAQIPQP